MSDVFGVYGSYLAFAVPHKLVLFFCYRLENIPDTSEQSLKNYTYTFSACSPFDCQEKGENNALVRERFGFKPESMLHCMRSLCAYVCMITSMPLL